MQDLVKALNIFVKYSHNQYPTHCENYELKVTAVTPDEVSEEDTKELAELGFFVHDTEDCFVSYRFGSNVN